MKKKDDIPCKTFCCPQLFYLEDEELYQITDDYGGAVKLTLAQLNRLWAEANAE
jgi:hypothetical protein